MAFDIEHPNTTYKTIAHRGYHVKEVVHKGALSSVVVCDSPEEYADYLMSCGDNSIREEYPLGRDQLEDASHCLRIGDVKLAAKAEKLMDQLRAEGIMGMGLPMPSRAVHGAQTIFPLFDAGIPNCMITREVSKVKGLNAPISIYWDRFRSGGASSREQIQARGIAILAFVLVMQNIRPVNLYMISCSNPSSGNRRNLGGIFGGLVRMSTQPLDLARACEILTCRHFSGRLTWVAMRDQFRRATNTNRNPGDAVGPLHMKCSTESQQYTDEHKAILGITPNDILFYGMHLYDTLSWQNPVEFVKRMIKVHIERQDETIEE